jgi:hypothetical protein
MLSFFFTVSDTVSTQLRRGVLKNICPNSLRLRVKIGVDKLSLSSICVHTYTFPYMAHGLLIKSELEIEGLHDTESSQFVINGQFDVVAEFSVFIFNLFLQLPAEMASCFFVFKTRLAQCGMKHDRSRKDDHV